VEWVSIMPKQCAAEEVEVNYNIGDLVRRHSGTKIGDLVQHQDNRIGIVLSEVFDFRPTWEDVYPAVLVRTRHGLPPHDEGDWIWQLEDIEVLGEVCN